MKKVVRVEIETYRDGSGELFCIIRNADTIDEVLLYEEEIRSTALEEAVSAEEKKIVLESKIIVYPRTLGGFYIEFE